MLSLKRALTANSVFFKTLSKSIYIRMVVKVVSNAKIADPKYLWLLPDNFSHCSVLSSVFFQAQILSKCIYSGYLVCATSYTVFIIPFFIETLV